MKLKDIFTNAGISPSTAVQGIVTINDFGTSLVVNYLPELHLVSIYRPDGVMLNSFVEQEWLAEIGYVEFENNVVPVEYQEVVTKLLDTEFAGEATMPGVDRFTEEVVERLLIQALIEGDVTSVNKLYNLMQ